MQIPGTEGDVELAQRYVEDLVACENDNLGYIVHSLLLSFATIQAGPLSNGCSPSNENEWCRTDSGRSR